MRIFRRVGHHSRDDPFTVTNQDGLTHGAFISKILASHGFGDDHGPGSD